MMIPVKIECGCGQRYAFDVEPVDGLMSFPVTCPACGADGTAAANAIIAQSLTPALAATPAGVVRLQGLPPGGRVATAPAPAVAAPAPRRAALLPGQIDRSQAEHEARAKIFWGDAPEEVVKFLMRQGISAAESQELVSAMFMERAKTIRRNGIKKVFMGIGLMCIPVAFFFGCMSVGYLPMKIFAVTIMVGLYGTYQALKGTIMFFAPKSEPGDVASH
jgi:hypothetical protein